jgi:O-antigen ligase
MPEHAPLESARAACPKNWNLINACVAIAAPALLSAIVVSLARETSELLAAFGMLCFLAVSVFLLMGDVFRRLVYCFFIVQFAVSFMLSLSFIVTLASLLFFPLALNAATRPNGTAAFPSAKPILLIIAGWAISLTYSCFVNAGILKYRFIYDVYFLLGLGVVYGLFIVLKRKLLDVDKLIYSIAFSGVVVICFVLMLYFMKGIPNSIFVERFGGAVNVNPNILASYIDLALPCAFFTAFFEKRSFVKKAFFYALSLIYVCVILMAATRGSLPGIAIIAAYTIWRKRSKRLLLGVLVCAVFAVSTLGSAVAERTFNPAMADIMSNLGRVEMLRTALEILKENHYFFGVGMNSYSSLKFEYGFPGWFDLSRGMSSHNLYLEIWLGCGLLGLLGWLILNASVVISLIRNNKNSGAANAVAFAIIAYLTHGFFDSVCANFSIAFVHFALIGIASFIIAQTRYAAGKPAAAVCQEKGGP